MESNISVDVNGAGNPAPDEVADLKGRILDVVREKGSVTFAELSWVSGFQGDEILFAVKAGHRIKNVVIWSDVSKGAVAALRDLLSEGEIIMMSYGPGIGVMSYGFDGGLLRLPLARSLRRGYRSLRWLPTFVTTPRWLELCDKLLTRPRRGRPPAYGITRGRGRVGRVAK